MAKQITGTSARWKEGSRAAAMNRTPGLVDRIETAVAQHAIDDGRGVRPLGARVRAQQRRARVRACMHRDRPRPCVSVAALRAALQLTNSNNVAFGVGKRQQHAQEGPIRVATARACSSKLVTTIMMAHPCRADLEA